jgi:hypothetical protein
MTMETSSEREMSCPWQGDELVDVLGEEDELV